MPVFGTVNRLRRCTEYRHTFLLKPHCQVIWYLATHGEDNTSGHLKVEYIHNTLKGELVKIQPVADIVIGAYCLRVVIYHHSPEAFPAYCVNGIYRAPVKLNARSYPVRSRSEDHNRPFVVLIPYIVLTTAVGEVQVICLCRILCRQGVNLLYIRNNAF